MTVQHLRLGLAVFFAAAAALLFLREEIAPGLAERLRGRSPVLGAWLAAALAGWNVARWYVDRVARRAPAWRNPLAGRPREREPEEPNPDFDFTDTNRPPTGPSANGDHKGA